MDIKKIIDEQVCSFNWYGEEIGNSIEATEKLLVTTKLNGVDIQIKCADMKHFERILNDLKNGGRWLKKNGTSFTDYEITATSKDMDEDELNYRLAPSILENIESIISKIKEQIDVSNEAIYKLSTLKKQVVLQVKELGYFFLEDVSEASNLKEKFDEKYKELKSEYMLFTRNGVPYLQRNDSFEGILGYKALPRKLSLEESKGIISDKLYNYLMENKRNWWQLKNWQVEREVRDIIKENI